MRKNKNYNKSLMKNIILSGYLLSNFTGGVVSLQASAPESGQPSINLATDELGRLILDRAAEVGKFSSWKILDEDAFINKVKELIRRGANMDEVRAWLTTSGPRKTQAIVGQLLARIDAADILRFEAPPPPQPLPASPPSARQPESGASGYSTFAPRQPDRPTDDRLTNALFSLTLDCALEGMNSEFRNEGWDLIERGADIERVRALFGDFDPVVRATAMRLLEEAEATRSTRSRASAPPPPAPRRPWSLEISEATRSLFNLILQWSNGELGTELYVFRNAADALINQGVDINGVERLLNDEFRLHPGIYDLDRQRSMMRVLGVVRSHCHLEGQTLQRQPTGFPPPAREPEFRAPPPAQGQFPPGAVEFRTVTRSLRDMLRDPQHRRDLNTQNDEGETPLFIAVINRDEDNVRAFLECPETGVNIPNGNGLTPLHAAVELGFTNIAILLIRDRRTNVNAQNGEGNTPLLLAAMRENAEIVQILLQHPAININAQNREGNTLLHLAVMEGNAEIVQILLQRPAININAQNREGNTLLHLAAMRENARIVQILLQRPDINVDIPNGDGITARMIIDDLAAREEGFMQ